MQKLSIDKTCMCMCVLMYNMCVCVCVCVCVYIYIGSYVMLQFYFYKEILSVLSLDLMCSCMKEIILFLLHLTQILSVK